MRIRPLLLTTTALIPIVLAPALAGPEGGAVVGGAATISGQGSSHVTVSQSSQNAVINWNTFNVGTGERVQFQQPNSTSATLNRVTGGLGPSQILGSIDANGRVFIVNRDGIIFGPGAVIKTGGFLATTSDIKTSDFMSGSYQFNIPGRPDASIVNMGQITATNGGFAALVAPGVRNSGTITANLGTVTLASGNTFSLDFYGDRLITLGVNDQIAGQVKDVATGETLKSLITNTGKLKANGGRVELTAAAARQVVDSVINTSGVIEANSVGTRDGQIVLSAAAASTKGGNAGATGLPTQTVKISGKLSAAGHKAGTKGGKIVVTGENIEVAGARIDASGRAGGGTVLIGGDWGGGKPDKSLVNNQSAVLDSNAIPTASTVSVDAATTINASARDSGNGGKVILWSDNTTTFAGTILALGGRELGNGGFAEVSSKGLLSFAGNVNTSAPNGRAGTLLLDPENYTIWDGFGPEPFGSSMTNADLQRQLASNNVTIATRNGINPEGQNGDIIVSAPVTWSANTLTLSAYRDIVLPNIKGGPNLVGTGSAGLVMRADNTGTGVGTVLMPGETRTARVDWTTSSGAIAVYYNPTSYESPTRFETPLSGGYFNLAAPSQLTAYMLVNSVGDLQRINSNSSGTYALGRDIDASEASNFAPLGTFTGILDGHGGLGTNYTISNLTIAPATATTNAGIGLFSSIGPFGIVRNLTIANATVTAPGRTNTESPPVFGQSVGILAGFNNGMISNVTVSGTVSDGPSSVGTSAGGGIL